MTRYGSDVVVDVLIGLGIRDVAFNPGASFRGLHDSLVYRRNRGGPALTMTLHEEIAVAAAHGYAKASGRPMAVALHNVVGLQHACMALFNAWCDRVPVLAIGATGPVAADRRRPWIDWIHTAHVQGNHVREFTKWDDQPASVEAAIESLQRAHLLATTPPAAPVYVCLPVELQEDPVAEQFEISAAHAGGRAAPDPAAIAEVCELIAESKRPVIVADRAADRDGAFESLSLLARVIGAPIIDRGARMNVATTDSHDLTGDEAAVIGSADLILAFEVADLAGVLAFASADAPDALIVGIGFNNNLVGSWAADYQRLVSVAVDVPADAGLAAAALADACGAAPGSTREAAIGWRNAAISERHDSMRADWRKRALAAATARPIATEWLAQVIGVALGQREIILSNGTLNGWARRLWDWRRPGTHLGGNGGGGIGYGPGASIGAALAARGSGRMVVNLQPDGDLLFAPSALWTMVHEALPILTVVWNNGGYRNSEEHAERIAVTRGRPIEDAAVGNRIDEPHIDFVSLARAYGMHAEGPISHPSDVAEAVERAIRVVDAGEPALVDVRAADR